MADAAVVVVVVGRGFGGHAGNRQATPNQAGMVRFPKADKDAESAPSLVKIIMDDNGHESEESSENEQGRM